MSHAFQGLAYDTPGSRTVLPPPRPLRTARASFPASRSSLLNAPCGTRFHHDQTLAMHALMAGGMKEHPVLCVVAAAFGPPHTVLVVPSR